MSTLRVLREFAMLIAICGGATLGYCAGGGFSQPTQLVCAFVGMGAFGAFADICLRGGKN